MLEPSESVLEKLEDPFSAQKKMPPSI